MSSPIAKQLTGTFIADSYRPLSSTVAWAQQECRAGSLKPLLDKFAGSQEETLDMNLLLVEKVEGDGITARIPAKILDHESPHAFLIEVRIEINPLTRMVRRLDA